MSIVLVVDDEPAVRRLISAALAGGECETVTAPDAETALGLLEDRTPDAIITDIRLPGIDGVEFARKVRANARFATVPLAFISAFEAPPRFRQPPPVQYFRKPFDVDALTDWVYDVTHQHA
jgi:CheY-like chemotaxis protein